MHALAVLSGKHADPYSRVAVENLGGIGVHNLHTSQHVGGAHESYLRAFQGVSTGTTNSKDG